jgi:hypothetical protein
LIAFELIATGRVWKRRATERRWKSASSAMALLHWAMLVATPAPTTPHSGKPSLPKIKP